MARPVAIQTDHLLTLLDEKPRQRLSELEERFDGGRHSLDATLMTLIRMREIEVMNVGNAVIVRLSA